jgi:hypothetical protein
MSSPNSLASRASSLIRASAALMGISARLVPEQHSDRLQANDLCFARLIGLLLGDLGQRPMHRAPSTAGGCNAEASRRYLLESRALDPERQRHLQPVASIPL